MTETARRNVVIVGGGPAGWTAAIYAGRAGLRPTVLSGPVPGGQLTITTDVENFPGFVHGVQGPALMDDMRAQALRFGAEIIDDTVVSVDFSSPHEKRLRLEQGGWISSRCVIIATGARAKWLGIPGEAEFMGRGVSGCATCDGFFFKDQNVAVVGGGNVAVEEAIYLAGLARKVTLIHRRELLTCERILEDRLRGLSNIEFLWNTRVTEIAGSAEGVQHLVTETAGAASTLPIDGLFIAIGHEPATGFLNGAIALTPSGHIAVPKHGGLVETSVSGVYAAGDVMDAVYRQAVTSAGFGCMAALEAQRYLSAA